MLRSEPLTSDLRAHIGFTVLSSPMPRTFISEDRAQSHHAGWQGTGLGAS